MTGRSRGFAMATGIVVSGVLLSGLMRLRPPPLRVAPPSPGSTAIACQADEAGARLLLTGRVVDARGRPIAGAAVTVYNADAAGLYNPANSPTRVPRIRGVVQSDEQGRFQVLTVKPGAYPDKSEPAHVHIEALSSGYRVGYRAIWFEGDPLITPEKRAALPRDGETVIVRAESVEGLMVVAAEVVLSEN